MKKHKNTFKPYLINAFYTWAIDTGFTPLIEIKNDSDNKIPDTLKGQESIVFNIHPSATRNLIFSKDCIEFEAKFSDRMQPLSIHHKSIRRIFSKEDGYGLEFNVFEEMNQSGEPEVSSFKSSNSDNIKPIRQKKHLSLVKND